MSDIRQVSAEAVRAWLANDYVGPLDIRKEISGEVFTLPRAVVEVVTAEPLAPGEPVWNLKLVIHVTHDAEEATTTEAQADAAVIFAKLHEEDDDGNDQLAAFMVFCADQGLYVSAMYPEESHFTVGQNNVWVHAQAVALIAAV